MLTIEIVGGSSDTSEQGDLSRDGLSGADQTIIIWWQNKTPSSDAGKSPAPHHQNQDLNGEEKQTVTKWFDKKITSGFFTTPISNVWGFSLPSSHLQCFRLPDLSLRPLPSTYDIAHRPNIRFLIFNISFPWKRLFLFWINPPFPGTLSSNGFPAIKQEQASHIALVHSWTSCAQLNILCTVEHKRERQIRPQVQIEALSKTEWGNNARAQKLTGSEYSTK